MELTFDNTVELCEKHKVGLFATFNVILWAFLYGNPGVLYDVLNGILQMIFWMLMGGLRVGELLVIFASLPAMSHINSVLDDVKEKQRIIMCEMSFLGKALNNKVPMTSEDLARHRMTTQQQQQNNTTTTTQGKKQTKTDELAEKLALEFLNTLLASSGIKTTGNGAKSLDEFEEMVKMLVPNEKELRESVEKLDAEEEEQIKNV